MKICFFDLPESPNELTEENDVVRAAFLLAKELCKWGKHHVEFYSSKAFHLTPKQTTKEHFKQFLKDHKIDVAVWHTDSLYAAPFSLEDLPCKLVTVLHIVPTDSEQLYPDEIIKKLNLSPGAAKIAQPLARCKPRRLSIEEFSELCSSSYHFSYALSCSDKFVFLSTAFAEILLCQPDVLTSWGKIHFIPDVMTFGPHEVYSGEDNLGNKVMWKQKTTLYLKKPDLILKAWQHLQERFPDWKLSLIVREEDFDKLKSLASSLGLKNVSFGDVKDDSSPCSAKILCLAGSPDVVELTFMKEVDLSQAHRSESTFQIFVADDSSHASATMSDVDIVTEKLSFFMSCISLCAHLTSVTQKSASSYFSTEATVRKWETLLQDIAKLPLARGARQSDFSGEHLDIMDIDVDSLGPIGRIDMNSIEPIDENSLGPIGRIDMDSLGNIDKDSLGPIDKE